MSARPSYRCPSDAEIYAALDMAVDELLADEELADRVNEWVFAMHPEFEALFEREGGWTEAEYDAFAKVANESPIFEEALQQRMDELLAEMVTRRLQ